jgi:hypothetical protein
MQVRAQVRACLSQSHLAVKISYCRIGNTNIKRCNNIEVPLDALNLTDSRNLLTGTQKFQLLLCMVCFLEVKMPRPMIVANQALIERMPHV